LFHGGGIKVIGCAIIFVVKFSFLYTAVTARVKINKGAIEHIRIPVPRLRALA
jgi:hypothetical protein